MTTSTTSTPRINPPTLRHGDGRLGQYGDARGRLRPGAVLHRLVQALSADDLLDLAIRTAILDATDDPSMEGYASSESLARSVVPPDGHLITGTESAAEVAYLGYFCPRDLRVGVEALDAARESFGGWADEKDFSQQVVRLAAALVAVMETQA